MGVGVGVGAGAGAEEEADRTEEIFPLAMTYTVQNSGAALDTVLGTSVVLNLLFDRILIRLTVLM